jgi:hypothetical protein
MPDTAAPDLRRLGHFIAIVEALTDDAVASVASASGPAVDGAAAYHFGGVGSDPGCPLISGQG